MRGGGGEDGEEGMNARREFEHRVGGGKKKSGHRVVVAESRFCCTFNGHVGFLDERSLHGRPCGGYPRARSCCRTVEIASGRYRRDRSYQSLGLPLHRSDLVCASYRVTANATAGERRNFVSTRYRETLDWPRRCAATANAHARARAFVFELFQNRNSGNSAYRAESSYANGNV